MLKALELVGFKSFADKTRFEFDRGVTAIVGPNGSGKSNVVDAIKWVLGEQSPKSLRGKEMADCIFNGSGTRRSVNMAEVTLTFDNTHKILPLETPEVHITRRVYRSGEGEYLINRQPSRLRDIRDLFLGTGAATEAYSVIEQGKVDALLQSSPRDRREIFEEAAGISRFKAKKLESLRRLERVDQNLLRLTDIVVEVENQLKTVRSQASRARRFQEYNTRLTELRTQVSLVDYRRLTSELSALDAEMADRRRAIEARLIEADTLEARAREEDGRLAELEELVRTCERQMAENRQQIATAEALIQHERARSVDLEEEIDRGRRQLAALSLRSGDLEHQLKETGAALQSADERQREGVARLASDEEQLAQLQATISAQRAHSEHRQGELREQMRTVARLAGDIRSLESQLTAAQERAVRIQQRRDTLEATQEELRGQLNRLKSQEHELALAVEEAATQVATVQSRLGERREQRTSLQQEIGQIRGRIAGASERVALIEELEDRHEGLSPGVRQVLSAVRHEPHGPLGVVRGLVADLLQVNVETAPLVEAALGDLAGHVVVSSGKALYESLSAGTLPLGGRVGFLPLDLLGLEAEDENTPPEAREIDLEGERGVIGRADRFVDTSEEMKPLARRLLGRTWIVERLSDALSLAAKYASLSALRSARRPEFVTLGGETLRADGSLMAGPRHTTLGLISRKSELRELRQQIARLEARVAELEGNLEELAGEIESDERQLENLAVRRQRAIDTLGEHRKQAAAFEGRVGQLDDQRGGLDSELQSARAAQSASEASVAGARGELTVAEERVAEIERHIAEAGEILATHEAQRAEQAAKITAAKVVLAKSEERLEALRSSRYQLERDQDERRRTIGEARTQLAGATARLTGAEFNILRAETELAELYLDQEALSRDEGIVVTRRDQLRKERGKVTSAANAIRNDVRKQEEQLHARDLSAGELRHQRTALMDRFRDDFALDLAAVSDEAKAAEEAAAATAVTENEDGTPIRTGLADERANVEQEIEDLRRKIKSLGGVNLEALSELDELESRFNALSGQYQDLTKAKEALEQILQKINVDSRRLFLETFEAIRGHFQDLFRKVFGGGQGDVVLEEGADVLEGGIDIVARPPGKELRNISLMSGGEKTMTCVALLLAIFRNRPSPFCVLDEVDAALDEANVGRFTNVLQEFLAWTQFIVVTHSKKTMTCATTLYGVTMQESGISKRVSVRFDDVTDDGHIRGGRSDDPTPEPGGEDETQAA